MDCKRFEELLIEFIENQLVSSDMAAVKKHLSACPNCSREVEEYKEFRRMLNEETALQPSSETLARLSRAARDAVKRDQTPFWKKWFYSPILVPALSSALALFLWVSYGKNSPDLFFGVRNRHSTEVMAKKTPSGQEPNVQIAGEPALEDFRPGQGRALSKKLSPVIPRGSELNSGIEAAPPGVAPSAELPAGEVKETDKISDYKAETFTGSVDSNPLNNPGSEPSTQEEFAKRQVLAKELSEEEVVERNLEDEQRIKEAQLYSSPKDSYQDKLDLALKQQREGNCGASIKTSEDLLKASPPPPNSLMEKAYLSLAECYEKRGDWDRAILNYQNLQEAASEQARFAEDKIEGIRQKANLFRAKELELGNMKKESQAQ